MAIDRAAVACAPEPTAVERGPLAVVADFAAPLPSMSPPMATEPTPLALSAFAKRRGSCA